MALLSPRRTRRGAGRKPEAMSDATYR